MKEKMSLGERVFVFSDAGQREIAKEDWQLIPAENREEALGIFNELRENDGIINLEKTPNDNKVLLIKESHKKVKADIEDRRISLEDIRANFDKLSKEEQSSVLESMDNLKAANQKTIKEEGFKRLPSDLQATLGMSPENLKKLTEDQRTTLVKRFDDLVTVETEAKKKEILAEAIK